MKLIDNHNATLKEDLLEQIQTGSRLSIAASCFSMYAFQELKDKMSEIDELRFIFTSPTFTMERTPKQKREFFQKAEQPFTKSYLDIFNQIWNAPDKLQSTSWRNTTAASWSSLKQAK